MKQSEKKLLLVGLNEFNPALLKEASEVFDLKNLKKLLKLNLSRTTTDDTYDSDFLEPWVQWVSVQTGTPSSQHGIKHLGDIPNVGLPQIWETLSSIDVTSGVWGAMNAARAGAEKCLFFMPDPWTFSEQGYPEEVDQLLELPRYLAKNYLHLSPKLILNKLANLLKVVGSSKASWILVKEIPRFLKEVAKFRGNHFVFISFADYILTQLFLEFRVKYKPQFSFIFLNSIAHLQHHHWHGDVKKNQKLKVGFQYIDKTIGSLLDSLAPEEVFLVTNALSQKNTNEEPPWFLYRQKDQKTFLEEMGFNPLRVESHMTHDAHIFFETLEECMAAQEILEKAKINRKNLFVVESYKEEPLKLFYRIDFTDEVTPGDVFSLGGKKWLFKKYFEAIVRRTGKHIPNGTVLTTTSDFPDKIYNHQIADYILGYFLPDVELRDSLIHPKPLDEPQLY